MVIVKLSLICFPILLNHLLKMLPQVILLLVYLITYYSFPFSLIFFLIIIPSREILKYNDWSRFNKNSFLDDFNITNWNSIMEIEKNDVNISFSNYLSKVNSLIMPHVPMKKTKEATKFFSEALVYYSYTKLHS